MKEIFYFTPVEGGLCLIDCDSDDEYITVPSHYKGEKVVDVNITVFNNKNIRELVLPNTLENLEYLNLTDCIELRKLKLPNNLYKSGTILLDSCYSLYGFVLPDKLANVDEIILINCLSLNYFFARENSIQVNKTSIYNCDCLDNISVSLWHSLSVDILNRIVNEKFKDWDSVGSFEKRDILNFARNYDAIFKTDCIEVIPILIKENIPLRLSLYDVSRLLELSIESENTSINAILLDFKFNNFSEVEIKTFNEEKEAYELGFGLPKFEQLNENWEVETVGEGIHIGGYKGNDTKLVIPEGLLDGRLITGLFCGDEYDFNFIEELIVEAKINFLGDSTFLACSSLKSITFLDDTIYCIDVSCFENCINLEHIYIPNGVKYINKSAFAYCYSLKKITLPKSLVSIDCEAFIYCDNLKLVEFNSVVDVHFTAFANCKEVVFVQK